MYMYIYLKPKASSRESIYVPVYMCVFKFFPKTREPFMWNHNRIGEES